MKKFGETAIKAVELFTSEKVATPEEAWRKAANEVIACKSVRKKGCPKNAFLALCSEGKVKGIPAGNYTGSEKMEGIPLKH